MTARPERFKLKAWPMGRIHSLNVLAVLLVCLAGGLCLPMPFWGDQALFTLYAREMTQGAVLYRDLFDVKQPGIFMFYAAGGLLFGFTEVGIHLFELAYWIAFSGFAFVALRPYFSTRWGATLVPIFTVAAYYCFAGLLDLGQVEILVGFPLLVSWWLIHQADPGTRQGLRRYAAAGLVASAVVLLKHLYLLVILAFLADAGLRAWRRGGAVTDLRRPLAAFSAALAVPSLIVLAYFAAHGQLGRIWWAYFEMAPAAQMLTPRPVEYLLAGMRRFMIGHAPLLILAVLGCAQALRVRARPHVDLVTGMLFWGAAGIIAFPVLQGWPEYKWPLFTVPVGVLAVVGTEVLAEVARRLGRRAVMIGVAAGAPLAIVSVVVGFADPQVQTRLLVSVLVGGVAALGVVALASRPRAHRGMLVVLSAALGVAVGVAAIAPIQKVSVLAEHDFALTEAARTRFQRSLNDAYRAADDDFERLGGHAVLPGEIFVFGDPVVYLRVDRRQAVPILGWGPEFLDSRAWDTLYRDLRSTLPVYIVVTDYAASVIRVRYPPILELLDSGYTIALEGASGTWYVVR
jgi:hypothetical protein